MIACKMINPHVKPKLEPFIPATQRTALAAADLFARSVYAKTLKLHHQPDEAMLLSNRVFMLAMDGARLLDNFMNLRKGML